MGFLCAKWLDAVWLIKSAERRAPSAERRGYDRGSAAGATPPAIAA